MSANKYTIDFSYDPKQNGKQDLLITSGLKLFNPTVISAETVDGLRDVSVTCKKDIVNGEHLINAVKKISESFSENEVKVSITLYLINKEVNVFTIDKDFNDVKSFIERVRTDSDFSETLTSETFKDGFKLTFENSDIYENFLKKYNLSVKDLESKGQATFNVSDSLSEIYHVRNHLESRVEAAFA